MQILITGVSGFVGGHLTAYLKQVIPDATLHGTVLETPPPHLASEIICHPINLKNPQDTAALIAEILPDRIYHLAASAVVHRSFDDPWETLENNIRIQLNVILGCLKAKIAPRMLVVSSGEVYGVDQSADTPTTEDAPMRPANPYGVSKVTQDMLGLQYYLSHKLPIVRARPFNHIGPGQNTGFVATDFASQIAKIEAGLQPPVMHVGELSAERDFTDVRDIVRAYYLMVEQGTPGDVYNVSTGSTHSMRYILDTLLSYSNASIQVETNAGLHSSGVRRSWGDSTRLRQATGWSPSIALDQTLRDVLDDWRQRVTLLAKE